MKILFTIGQFGRGGKERRLASLMQALAERGFTLGVIAGRNSPHLPGLRDLCQQVYEYKSGDPVFNIREHRRAVREFQPDLIHSWSGSCTIYALIARLGQQCKVITSEITNSKPLRVGSLSYWRTRFSFHFADFVLSNSDAGLTAKRAPAGRSGRIYNGYRLERLESADRRKFDSLRVPGTLNVVMAARFSRHKDYSTVLDAAAFAEEQRLPVIFHLAGEGPDLPRLQREAELRALKHVKFLGYLPDIDSLLCHMDIGVLATDPQHHEEGISNFLVECMAHRMPVLATRGRSTGEVVHSGWNGFVLEPGDARELLGRLRELAHNEALREEMGRNGHQMVVDVFDLRKMVGRFIATYESVLSGHPQTGGKEPASVEEEPVGMTAGKPRGGSD
jgi:glycosyltransferase involved in cell wall biosynthesis